MTDTEPRKVSQTVDADGNVTEVVYAPPKITVSYSRKVNLGNYESEDYYCAVSADVGLTSTDEDKIAAIRGGFLIARSSIAEQRGVEFSVTDQVMRDVVERTFGQVEEVTEPAPKATAAEPRKSNGGGKRIKDKAVLWAELVDHPEKWWDNRADKPGPSNPDFKRVGTGEGLWLTDKDTGDSVVPDAITLPSQGFKNSGK